MKTLTLTFGLALAGLSQAATGDCHLISDITTYVVSDIPAKSGYRFEADVTFIDRDAEAILFGATKGSSVKYVPIGKAAYYEQCKWYYDYGSTLKKSGTVVDSTARNLVASTLRAGVQSITVDDKVVASGTTAGEVDTGMNIGIFALYDGEQASFQSATHFYRAAVWDADEKMIRFFVPHTDGTRKGTGLLDVITGKFYPDAGNKNGFAYIPGRGDTNDYRLASGKVEIRTLFFAPPDGFVSVDSGEESSVAEVWVPYGETRTFQVKATGTFDKWNLTWASISTGEDTDATITVSVTGGRPATVRAGSDPDTGVVRTAKVGRWSDAAENWTSSIGLHRMPTVADDVSVGNAPNEEFTISVSNEDVAVKSLKLSCGDSMAGATSRLEIVKGGRFYVDGGGTLADADNSLSEIIVSGGSLLQIRKSNVTGSKSSTTARFNLTVEDSTVEFLPNAVITLNNSDSLRIKSGRLTQGSYAGQKHGLVLNKKSSLTVEGGTVELRGSGDGGVYGLVLYGGGSVHQTGGTLTLPVSAQDQGSSVVEVSGGTLNIFDMMCGNRSGNTSSDCALCVRGVMPKINVTCAIDTMSSDSRTLPAYFWDFRLEGDSAPGGQAVAPVTYKNNNTAYQGVWRLVPDGGLQVAYTNLVPLLIGTKGRSLVSKGSAACTRLSTTQLFQVEIPSDAPHTIRARLLADKELPNGWSSETARSGGWVRIPAVRGREAVALRVRLNLVAGTRTLEDCCAEFVKRGALSAAVKESNGYNVTVELPPSRLVKGFDSSMLFLDFTDYTSNSNAQSDKVTTYATFKAVKVDVVEKGLMLMVY